MTDINRENLLQILNLTKPAVAGQAYVPALTHFAFDGLNVVSYNDISSISVRTTVDLEMCLPADMLMKTLGSMSSESVLIQKSDDNAVVIASGRSKVKIPYLELNKFPFEFPVVDWQDGFDVTADMLNGIDKCLVGVGTDPTHPAQMGVTLESTAKGCTLYSTDNFSISRYQSSAHVELPGDVPIIIPTFFCQQLLGLSRAFPGEDVRVGLPPGAIVAHFGESAIIFTKVLVDLTPMDFVRVVTKYLHGTDMVDVMLDIPNGFESALERALLVLSTEHNKTTKVTVADGKMKLFSSSTQGEASDVLAFDHKDIDPFFADPGLVGRASKICRKMGMLDRVMVLTDGAFTHLIAHCSV